MALSFDEKLVANKRLLEEQLKKPNNNRAEIMIALQAVREQQSLGEVGVRNALAMKNTDGKEILYMLLKKNSLKRLFLNIKKKVFELFSKLGK